MALDDLLRQKRERTEVEAEKARQELAAVEAKKAEDIEKQRVEAIRAQIAGLQTQKTELEANLQSLKASYGEASGKLETYKTKSRKIDSVLDKPENKEVLSGMETKDKKGKKKDSIDDKGDLMRAPEFQEDEDVVGYKEAGQDLRSTTETLGDIKENVTNGNSDLKLDFRGGKKGSETQSPREESFAKLEAKIIELDKQITELELQTPEGKERIYEKQVGECLKMIGNKKQSLGDLSSHPHDIPKIDTLGFWRGANDIRHEVARLSSTYNGAVVNEAVFRNFSEELQRIIDENQKKTDRRFGNKDQFKALAEKLLKIKINFDVIDLKRQKLIDEKKAGSIVEKASQIHMNGIHKEVGLTDIARMRLNMKMDGVIKTKSPVPRGGRFEGNDFEVLSQKKYVSDEAKRLASTITDLQANLTKVNAEYIQNRDHVPFFGKAKHLAHGEKIRERLGQINVALTKARKDLETRQQRDSVQEVKLDDLSRLVNSSRLSNERSLLTQSMTVKEFLDEVERLLKEKAEQKLTPEEELVKAEYEKVQDEFSNARNELDRVNRGY